MGKKSFRRPDGEAMRRLLGRNEDTCAGLILRLAWNMGLSLDEMHGLKWNDISFETGALRLSDRRVPLDADTVRCLQMRQGRQFHRVSEYVVISDRRRAHMHRVYISKTAQAALGTEAALKDITLKDLREDFVLRQLTLHDSAWVARISGLTLATLNSTYLPCVCPDAAAAAERKQHARVEAVELEALACTTGAPAGLAIWLAWKLGLELEELVALEWRQVDWTAGVIRLSDRQEAVDDTMRVLLRQAYDRRRPDAPPQILLSRNAQTPFDVSYLSRVVRMALIRGGMERIKLRDLKREEQRSEGGAAILAYAARTGHVNRNEAMELLHEGKTTVYRRLRRLTEQGKLVRIGAEYYPAGTVVPPEEQYDLIRAYLEREGGAYRQDLAALLRIAPQQCGWILQTMVKEGRLHREKQWYTLPEQETISS
ncbi:MAG: hypothetical protein E7443_05085 [Ruminococcaceae bacterium]|nr:hypothetical protein [Oscillospiraceae bacterium]